MNGVWVGASLARERLRGGVVFLVLGLSGAMIYTLGALARSSGQGPADSTLEGPVFGLALPILAYLLSERACGAERLDRCVDSVARYGTDRRAAMLGVLLTSAAWMAFGSALLTALGLLGAHSSRDSNLLGDLRASLGIALLSGAVYATYFSAASLLGKRGGGRKWALVLDFVLGAGSSALAAPWPRGHARNLLGGVPVLGLSQAGAWLALLVIGVGCVALSVARTPS